MVRYKYNSTYKPVARLNMARKSDWPVRGVVHCSVTGGQSLSSRLNFKSMDIMLPRLIVAVILGLDIKSTLLVLRDSLSEPKQLVLQLAFVWLLPLIGAIVVLAIHRSAEKHSGTYRGLPDPGVEFGFTDKGARGHSDDVDSD
jgi:hypothetical protein